jgi:hypothetical protein
LPINYTTLKQATYIEVAFGATKYHQYDGGIPKTEIMLLLLDHGLRTDERDPPFFGINFPDSLPINCTTLKQATYLRAALGNT